MTKITSIRFKAAISSNVLLGFAILTGCSTNVSVAPPTTSSPTTSVSSTNPSSSNAPPTNTSDDNAKSIAWQPSYEMAWATAYRTKKPLMIDFYTDWCGACKVLDADTYTNSKVIRESDKFISVKINAEKRTDIAQQFGIRAYPTIVWLDNRAQLLHKIEGALPPDDFISEMQTARSKFKPLG